MVDRPRGLGRLGKWGRAEHRGDSERRHVHQGGAPELDADGAPSVGREHDRTLAGPGEAADVVDGREARAIRGSEQTVAHQDQITRR